MKYLKDKILNLVRRAIITIEKDGTQFGQCEYQETVSNYEAIKPYGFASTAPKEKLVVLFNVGADSSNKVGFEYDNSNQFEVEVGEVAVFHPVKKSYIHFKDDGTIDIEAIKDLTVKVQRIYHSFSQTVISSCDRPSCWN